MLKIRQPFYCCFCAARKTRPFYLTSDIKMSSLMKEEQKVLKWPNVLFCWIFCSSWIILYCAPDLTFFGFQSATVKLANSASPFKFCQVKFLQKTGLENGKKSFSQRETEHNWHYLWKTHFIFLNKSSRPVFYGKLTWRNLKGLADLPNLSFDSTNKEYIPLNPI